MSTDLKYWLAFSATDKFGYQKINRLQRYFPSLKEAWLAAGDELVQAGLNQDFVTEFIFRRKDINPDQELEKISAEQINIVTINDENYPKLLKEIYSPPFILYYKGELNNIPEPVVAVVGTRKMTHYGKIITEKIVRELVEQEIIIVSGLALGIDTIAHLTAIQNHGRTIAVLGSGLDKQNIYPTTNQTLATEIVAQAGLLISEFPIGTLPLRHNFPIRNRVIAGLSLGTLVVEAGETSGALITAHFALEQNREVFAIPGNLTNPLSEGTNNLIKKGAKLVTSAEDILEELNIKRLKQIKPAPIIVPESPEEAVILKFLQTEPLHVNELVKLSALSITEINATLLMLELKEKIKNIGNMTYSII